MRILVVASEPVDPERLDAVLDVDLGDAEVRVVTPALNDSRLAFWVSDADEAIADAEDKEDESVEALRDRGVDAEGETGESVPLVALQDALATFAADRVVVFRDPESSDAYREDELAEVQERLGVPVVAVSA